jgi:hypothetical protein
VQSPGMSPTNDNDISHCDDVIRRRMSSSGMLRRVAVVRTDVSEERSACIIKVTRIGHPDDGGTKFLRNVGFYKNHTA